MREIAAARLTTLAEVPLEFAEVVAIQRSDDIQGIDFGCEAACTHEADPNQVYEIGTKSDVLGLFPNRLKNRRAPPANGKRAPVPGMGKAESGSRLTDTKFGSGSDASLA